MSGWKRKPNKPVTPAPGELLVYPGGGRLRLPEKRFAAGGEAELYRCGRNALAKVPHAPTPRWTEKAEWAVRNRRRFADPRMTWAAWPQRLIVEPTTKRVVGVVLPLLKDCVPLSRALDPAWRARLFPHWDGATLVGVAANVVMAFDWLHERGVVHGDGSAANVMVNAAGRVALIDCDNSQYTTDSAVLRCGVTTGDYCPPELQPKTEAELEALTRSPAQDAFSVVVIALQLLSAAGAHPYSGRWDKRDGSRPPATERRIEINAWPGARVGPGAGRVAPPTKALPPGSYGAAIAELTRRTLDDGWRSPDARPPLKEWGETLRRLRRALRPCAANARHAYHRSLGACPYCGVKQTAGVDLMPRPPKAGLRLKRDSGWATPSS